MQKSDPEGFVITYSCPVFTALAPRNRPLLQSIIAP